MLWHKPDNRKNEPGFTPPRLYSVILLAYPLILLFVMESFTPEQSPSTPVIVQGSLLNRLLVAAANYALFLALVLLLYGLFKSMFTASAVLGGLLFIFYSVNYYRWFNTGLVFTPGDLIFTRNFLQLLPFAVLRFNSQALLALLALSICSMFFYLHRQAYRQRAAKGKKRLALVLGSLAFLGVFMLPASKTTVFRLTGAEPAHALQYPETLYKSHGTLLGFVLLSGTAPSSAEQPPGQDYLFNPTALQEEYSPEHMEDILQEIYAQGTPVTNTSGIKPNVIVIMSEAFWDPSHLQGVEFSEEPLPNYKSLAAQYPSGNILTPVIGGLTCNVEYEFLLMDSMLFYTQGEVPFESPSQCLPEGDDPLALPRQFKQNGYHTVAIHPYDKSFYNRGTLYPRLGFDTFISREDMPDAPIQGDYISDEYFTQRIISEIEHSTEPLFLFGISMENHYPYEPYRYDDIDIRLSSRQLDPPDIASLHTYTQGVHNADAALGQLITYLETQTEPTLLLFYGDHLPIWQSTPLNAYYKGGYISTKTRDDWNLTDKQHMYNTPYLLWANFTIHPPAFQDLSPMFAGPILLDTAGLALSPHAAYLLSSMQYFHGIHPQLYINGRGEYLEAPTPEGGSRLNNLYLVHLDRFEPRHPFGQRYTVDKMAQIP